MRGRLHKIIMLTGVVIGTSGELWTAQTCKTEPMDLLQSIKEEAVSSQHSTLPRQHEIKLEKCTSGDYHDSKPITIKAEMNCESQCNPQYESDIALHNPKIDTYLQAMADSQ